MQFNGHEKYTAGDLAGILMGESPENADLLGALIVLCNRVEELEARLRKFDGGGAPVRIELEVITSDSKKLRAEIQKIKERLADGTTPKSFQITL